MYYTLKKQYLSHMYTMYANDSNNAPLYTHVTVYTV